MTERTETRVDQMDRATAVKYGLFVQAAYEMYDLNPTNPNPPPGPNFPKGYMLGWTIQMTEFFGGRKQRLFYGFLAQSKADPNEIVVALRGTRTKMEWWDDFHWELTSCQLCGGAGNVAAGFLDIYKTLGGTPASGSGESRPLPEVLSLLHGPPPIHKVIVTGHSLGAALITLFALDSACQGSANPTVYTFASPRVGDTAFATKFQEKIGTSYRVWNYWDEVTYWPKNFPWADQFQHVKGGYEINSWDKVHLSLSCNHALNSYLYILDSSQVNLDPACKPWAESNAAEKQE